MWLYYAHLYMSVLHCVFHVFHEHVITTSNTGYPHKYDGPWQFRIGSNQVSLVISYIFVDMITSYLTNLVITWRSYYIIYNICTCVYVYIYIYIDQSSHTNIVWLVGQLRIWLARSHLGLEVPTHQGTPRGSPASSPVGTPRIIQVRFCLRIGVWPKVDQYGLSMVCDNGLLMVCDWFINGLWMVYQWLIDGLSIWFINGLWQWFVRLSLLNFMNYQWGYTNYHDGHCYHHSWTINGHCLSMFIIILRWPFMGIPVYPMAIDMLKSPRSTKKNHELRHGAAYFTNS